MVLYLHSNGSYLSESQYHIYYGSSFFLVYQKFDPSDNNGAILTISQIIKNLMESACEAECAALFINARETIILQVTL